MKEPDNNTGDTQVPLSFQTPIGKITLQDGVVIIAIDRERPEPEDMQGHIDLLLGVSQESGQLKMPVLLDLGPLAWMNWETRLCAIETMRPEWNEKVAILYRNPVQMIISAFFLGDERPPYPVMITGDRSAALDWLNDPQASSPPLESFIPEPANRLEALAVEMCRIGLGTFSGGNEIPGDLDELDAVACGLAMLTEEIISMFAERDSAEKEAARHRKRLELLVQERTSEVRDTNESLKREIEVRKAAEEQLQRINEDLISFAHTVSHDLKGPLSVIQSAGETLVLLLSLPDPVDPEHASELADIITRSTLKATTLIEDILALAEAGQVPSDIEQVDISDVVALIVDERTSELSRKGVALEVSDDLGTIRASRTHMYQVFTNLITNVIQHNDSATPAIQIRALPAHAPEHRYLVRENGSGIPEEDLEKIFEPFFKGAEGLTGIGLSTVSKIAGVYGGDVFAYNENGACFEVTIRDFTEL
jgi:signal transduction histidine kinase